MKEAMLGKKNVHKVMCRDTTEDKNWYESMKNIAKNVDSKV